MVWSMHDIWTLQKVSLWWLCAIYLLFLGLAIVYGKYLKGGYGHCPRALCDNFAVLPVGMNDLLRRSRVKVFCPKCEDVYIPDNITSVALDGAYFGTSLANGFLLAYHKQITMPPAVYMYEPKIYGFKLAGKRGSMIGEGSSHKLWEGGIVCSYKKQELGRKNLKIIWITLKITPSFSFLENLI